MTDAAIGWELYRSFLAILQEGSLSGAARTLKLAQPTVGRHLDALEQALGVALFTRSRKGLAPTDAADALRPHAEAMRASAEALLRAAAGSRETVAGVVRITASETIGGEVLPPILARLQEAHPKLVVELVLSNRTDDLLQREADIAVRMVRPAQQALVARRVGAVALGLHAHRRYLERRGVPAAWADLKSHAIVGFDEETPVIRAMRAALDADREFGRHMFSLRADSDLAQLAAIRAGCGVGICQVGLARRDPDLVRILAESFEMKLETWVAMHRDLRASPRCRAAFDALAAGLAAYIAEAEGCGVSPSPDPAAP